MLKIYILSGPDIGKTFAIDAGATFGRAPDCAVLLRDASVSRYHARLEHEGDAWSIVDTGSRNGLRVHGERVTSARLADGDEFTLGEVLLRLRVMPDAAAATAPHHGHGLADEIAIAPLTSAPVTTAPKRDVAPEPQSAAPVAPPVRVPPPARPSVDVDEIELEGDWDANAAAAAASTAPRTLAPEPIAPRPDPLTQTARQQATAKLAAAGALPKSTASRGILQYNKVEARDGFANAELGQQPLWIKALVTLLALVVFAAVFWTAFHGTAWLKGKSEPASIEETEEAPR